MRKKGISMVILVITIVILLILLGATTVMVGNSIENSKKSAFASDLASLEDAITVYNIQNGELPILSESNNKIEYIYSNGNIQQKTSGTKLVTINNKAKFEEELQQNNDTTNTVFYKLDLKKINVEKIKRGTGENGTDDIYLVSSPSQTVYYLKGLNAGDETYYSLAKLSTLESIQTNEEVATGEATIVKVVSGMTVKRVQKEWSNTLDIIVDAYLESNETLYIKIPQSSTTYVEKQLTTTAGQNLINIVTLKNSLNLTNAQETAFNNLDKSLKKAIIVKKQGTAEVGTVTVDLSNFETEIPQFPLKADGTTYDFTIKSNEDHNLVSYKGIDKISGIKEVRYVVIKEYDESGNIKAVHKDANGNEILQFTSEYMLKNGEKASVSTDNRVDIKVEKEVEAIYITMYDKAGNSISMQKNTRPSIYVGINLKEITSTLKFDYTFNANSNVTTAVTSISTDNLTYTEQKNLSLTQISTGKHTSTTTFTNSNKDVVYVKVVATDASGNKETRVKKVELTKEAHELMNTVVPGTTYSENRTYIDKNGDKAVLPVGFKVSRVANEQTIQDGLVIQDRNENEFVWIPCTLDGANGSVKYERRFSQYPKNSSITSVSDDASAIPEYKEGTNLSENTQIASYNGFYVGRYEAGVPDDQTVIDGLSKASSNKKGLPSVKKGKHVWGYISYTNAAYSAKLVSNSKYVKSGLITGTQWDTICAWITTNTSYSVTNSISWGNYNNDSVDGNSGLKNTGSQEQWKVKNIYDFAGNAYEWTAEKNSTYYVNRGGSYYYSGSGHPAAFRGRGIADTAVADLSFRVVLYVM